jgi:hypothetical protein
MEQRLYKVYDNLFVNDAKFNLIVQKNILVYYVDYQNS